jgi:hypothetical protein
MAESAASAVVVFDSKIKFSPGAGLSISVSCAKVCGHLVRFRTIQVCPKDGRTFLTADFYRQQTGSRRGSLAGMIGSVGGRNPVFDLRRRDFITLVGAASAWPLAARAQQPAMPVIGFLGSESPNQFAGRLLAFRQGLNEVGFVGDRWRLCAPRWQEALEAGQAPRMVLCHSRRRSRLLLARRSQTLRRGPGLTRRMSPADDAETSCRSGAHRQMC